MFLFLEMDMNDKNNGYEVHSSHFCIDDYKPVADEWSNCPYCKIQPKVWEFDNGRQTACGCWNNRYDHFSIRAESIMSVVKRCNGSAVEYNRDDLRKNWNHWCETGEVLFEHASKRNDGKW